MACPRCSKKKDVRTGRWSPRGEWPAAASAERSSAAAFLGETRGHRSPGPDTLLHPRTPEKIPRGAGCPGRALVASRRFARHGSSRTVFREGGSILRPGDTGHPTRTRAPTSGGALLFPRRTEHECGRHHARAPLASYNAASTRSVNGGHASTAHGPKSRSVSTTHAAPA